MPQPVSVTLRVRSLDEAATTAEDNARLRALLRDQERLIDALKAAHAELQATIQQLLRGRA